MQKVLRVEPTPNGDGYLFFSVNMNNKPNGTKSSVSVPGAQGHHQKSPPLPCPPPEDA